MEPVKQIRNIGVIMDGNRRWARQHKLESVLKGHEQGAERFIDFCGWCKEAGIHNITCYAFSYENWNRTKEEVSGLFSLMQVFFKKYLKKCMDDQFRLHIVGDWSLFDDATRETFRQAEEATRQFTENHIYAAISYSGHNEYLRMAQKIAADAKAGRLDPDKLDEATLRSYLDMQQAPDIDLLIRTGGDKRLSGFFPYQTAYSEIYFTPTLWPDMSRELLLEMLNTYYNKTRINLGK